MLLIHSQLGQILEKLGMNEQCYFVDLAGQQMLTGCPMVNLCQCLHILVDVAETIFFAHQQGQVRTILNIDGHLKV